MRLEIFDRIYNLKVKYDNIKQARYGEIFCKVISDKILVEQLNLLQCSTSIHCE